MTNPAVSIVIPIFNTENYLRECFESLRSQTFTDFEVICVDDGSTDASLKIIQEYASKDARFVVHRQEHSNAGSARNCGLNAARGKYVYFLDSDDTIDSSLLQTCIMAAELHCADVVVFAANTYDDKTKEVKPLVPWEWGNWKYNSDEVFSPLEKKDIIINSLRTWAWNKMFKKKLIEDNNIVFQSIPRTNDMAFVFQALVSACRIAIVNLPLINYRVNSGNSLQQTNHETPLSFAEAYIETKTRLEKLGHYANYKCSLVNEVIGGTVYNLLSIKTEESQLIVLDWIINRLDTLFRVNEVSEKDIYDANMYSFSLLKVLMKVSKASDGMELLQFVRNVRNDYEVLARYADQIKAEYELTKSEYDKLAQVKDKYKVLKCEYDELKKDKYQLENKVNELTKMYNGLAVRTEMLIGSWSYRIGRIVTYIPRELRNFFIGIDFYYTNGW